MMDPLFKALSLYRRRRFDDCIAICTESLRVNPYDQAFWSLKTQCLTQSIYVDDCEADEDGVGDILLSEDAISDLPRPGTSLRNISTSKMLGTSQAVRPVTQSGRPITGILRPGTQSNDSNIEGALNAPRTSKTARPMTSSAGRFVRLGTASMLSSGSDGPFINLQRLNLSKYSAINTVNRNLFEYILLHENDVRLALDLAAASSANCQFKDWWWKLQLGKCYYKVSLFRDAENQLKSCLAHADATVDPYLWLGKVYVRMDQPISAIEVYKKGLGKFPQEMTLQLARIREGLGEADEAVKLYRDVLKFDAVCIEAIACIAMHHFYSDQPEVALRYYRRILQLNAASPEVYNNLGLCCYYSQQFDMAIACFERALLHSDSDETTSEIWYNLGQISLSSGDRQLATQCFRLAIVSNNTNSEAYNNLGAIEGNRANRTSSELQQAKSLFQASAASGKHLYEPLYNLALIGEETGQYQAAFECVKKSIKLFPTFYGSSDIFNKLKKMYESV